VYSLASTLTLLASSCYTHAPQVEAHPYWRNTPLLDWAASKGIHVTAYSPLGSPDSATMMQRGPDTPSLLQDTTVGAIAARCGKSPAQVRDRMVVADCVTSVYGVSRRWSDRH
jgi:diketogulonate reductase-like aldo/keto reductase